MRPKLIESIKAALGKEVIAFDTETTGLSPESDYITEIGAVKAVVQPNGIIKGGQKRLHTYIKVPVTLSPKIVELTGITDEFLSDKPTEDEIFDQIYSFFGESPIVLGYNVPYDVGMMNGLYKRHGKEFKPQYLIDVLAMVRDVIKGDTKNNQLSTIAEYYGLKTKFHSAVGDIAVTGKIYNLLVPEYFEKAKGEPIKATIQRTYTYKYPTLICETDYGRLMYNVAKHFWGSTQTDVTNYDFEHLEQQLLILGGSDNLYGALKELMKNKK